MGNSWSCVSCRSGAPQTSTNEPGLEVHHAHETLGPPWHMTEYMAEPMLVPIDDVPEHMWDLDLHVHLVYRPEDDQFVYLAEIPRPVPVQATEVTEPTEPCVWLTWLQERIDYGEPW